MSDDGSVPRQDAIHALRCSGAEVKKDSKPDMYEVAKGDILQVLSIPDPCDKRLIHYLKRRFTTPIHHFYNPVMAPSSPDETKQ